MNVKLIFPHQLFEDNPLTEVNGTSYLIEEHLFFSQYDFHWQKLVYHKQTMLHYQDYLEGKKQKVKYISSDETESDIRVLIKALQSDGVNAIHYIDPVDDYLQRRIEETCVKMDIETVVYESPMFFNSQSEVEDYFHKDRKRYLHADWYKKQRKKLKILVDDHGEPEGGKWSTDAENRKKYPRKKVPPLVTFPKRDKYFDQVIVDIKGGKLKPLGNEPTQQYYPTTFAEAKSWLDAFLVERFQEFGIYEDAITMGDLILHHGVLTPMLNVGLLTPHYIIDTVLEFSDNVKNNIPLNTLEGFIRQVIGWREYIRGMYQATGRKQRTTNYWGFKRKLPQSFYDGTTGILPFDNTIKKVLETGYCHHIERLMVLGNFMLLSEIDPDEVYRWFMELFIDAYDWVMVPNVYGMSQFADGGLVATKPYISGSNYILKMSNYSKGEWQTTWDGLFWRFMHVHRDFFLSNPRLGMLIRMYDKMPAEKQQGHLETAEEFLSKLG
jgi:deoxyribodipyrimidine photolyase-related protein